MTLYAFGQVRATMLRQGMGTGSVCNTKQPQPNDRNISTQDITTLLAQYLQAPAK